MPYSVAVLTSMKVARSKLRQTSACLVLGSAAFIRTRPALIVDPSTIIVAVPLVDTLIPRSPGPLSQSTISI